MQNKVIILALQAQMVSGSVIVTPKHKFFIALTDFVVQPVPPDMNHTPSQYFSRDYTGQQIAGMHSNCCYSCQHVESLWSG